MTTKEKATLYNNIASDLASIGCYKRAKIWRDTAKELRSQPHAIAVLLGGAR
jgi:hypothetical protein